MVQYRYLGYGVTDEKGIAKLDHDTQGRAIEHSYTGTGAGLVDIVASLDETITGSSLVSETFVLYDCIKYDNATQSDHKDIWNQATTYLNRGTEYSTLTDSNIELIYTPISGDIVIEVDVNVYEASTSGFVSIRNGNTALFNITKNVLGLGNDEWMHIILKIENNECTVTNTTNSRSATSDVTGFTRFYFRNGADMSVKFKNFKVYPI